MKYSKFDLLLGGALNAMPLWLVIIPMIIVNFSPNNITDLCQIGCLLFILAFSDGIALMRINQLEIEVQSLKNELGKENKSL